MTDELRDAEDDNFDPEAAERAIREFIDSAESLPGPAVGELADLVEGVVVEAWERIQELLSGQRHDKVLATQLLLGQRAREATPDDPEQWRLHAASTLLSDMIAVPATGRPWLRRGRGVIQLNLNHVTEGSTPVLRVRPGSVRFQAELSQSLNMLRRSGQ